jgi:hypothetical protein
MPKLPVSALNWENKAFADPRKPVGAAYVLAAYEVSRRGTIERISAKWGQSSPSLRVGYHVHPELSGVGQRVTGFLFPLRQHGFPIAVYVISIDR